MRDSFFQRLHNGHAYLAGMVPWARSNLSSFLLKNSEISPLWKNARRTKEAFCGFIDEVETRCATRGTTGGWKSPAMPLRYALEAEIANDGVIL